MFKTRELNLVSSTSLGGRVEEVLKIGIGNFVVVSIENDMIHLRNVFVVSNHDACAQALLRGARKFLNFKLV